MRKTNLHRQQLILAGLLLTTACIEPFEVDVPTQSNTIVVEGMLADDPEFQSVILRLHSATDSITREITGARVELLDDKENLVTYLETEPGKYVPPAPVFLFEGQQYRIRIGIGDTVAIESDWQAVPPNLELEAGYFSITTRTSINANGFVVPTRGVSYFVNTQPAYTENIFLRYSYISAHIMRSPMSGNCTPCDNCYIVSPAKNHVKTALIENSVGKNLTDLEVAFIQPYQDYSVRKTLRILQFSINRKTYEYYAAIEKQKSIRGSLFDPPPSVLKNNLSDRMQPGREVYGLFEVARVSEVSVPVTRNAFSFHITTYEEVCTPNNLNTNPQCADCRVWPGATRERPDWF